MIVDEYPQNTNERSWIFENHQRNKIANGLTDCKKGDVVLISDVDEIPNPEIVFSYKDKPGIKICH